MNLSNNHKESVLAPFSVEYRLETAVDQLAEHLVERCLNHAFAEEIVIVCIGTDRSTGDALGPLVGSKLIAKNPLSFQVYGTLEEPVHAGNLSEKLDVIQKMHPEALLIAVDACLGQFSNVGKINVVDGPLKPGAGVKKELPAVGTFHITGIVNVGGFMEYFVLQNTRLFLVMQMAEIIAAGLAKASSLLVHATGDASQVCAYPD